MKKIIIGASFILITFQSGNGMEKTFASFKDALLGKPRNIMQEITEVSTDITISEAIKERKLAALYTDIRNQYRGKEQYEEYNKRVCEHRNRAEYLDNQQKEAAKAQAERDTKYQEISILLSLTTVAVEKIELYRRLASNSASEQQAQENNAQIKALEIQITAEHKKEALIDERLKQISALSTLISETETDQALVPFKRIDILAGLHEKRAALSKDINALENNIVADLSRAQKLRRESIVLAPDQTTRLAIIRSLQS